MKALVLAIAHDAFDDPNIWIEPLQKSISGHRADRRRIISSGVQARSIWQTEPRSLAGAFSWLRVR